MKYTPGVDEPFGLAPFFASRLRRGLSRASRTSFEGVNTDMYKLTPSDFAYLYEECKPSFVLRLRSGLRMGRHCYYLKIRSGIVGDR